MQGEILLVNPRRRRRRAVARGAGGRFVKVHRARRVNARRKRRRNPVAALAANPRRRRRRRNPIAAFAANPRRRRRRSHIARAHRRRRRNPIGFSTGRIMGSLAPAIIGGAGALGLDIALGAMPFIPEQLRSGPLKRVTQVAAAFGLGWAVSKAKPGWGKPVTLGALTVIAYASLRELAARFAPTLPGLSAYETDYQIGYVDPAPQLQAYMPPSGVSAPMGAYMQDSGDLGNYSSDGM